jgi:hypothetical protein
LRFSKEMLKRGVGSAGRSARGTAQKPEGGGRRWAASGDWSPRGKGERGKAVRPGG